FGLLLIVRSLCWFQRTQARVWGIAVGPQRNQSSSGLICFRGRGVVPVLKERLIDFSLNSEEPFFRASRTVAKIVCLRFKFARSLRLQATENDLKRLMADVLRAMEKAQGATARIASNPAVTVTGPRGRSANWRSFAKRRLRGPFKAEMCPRGV